MNRFDPSSANGKALRCEMDHLLWASVQDLLDDAGSAFVQPRRARPLDYCAYSDLALTIPDWQHLPAQTRSAARAHLRARLSDDRDDAGEAGPSRPRIRNFAEQEFSLIELDRISRWFCTEEANYLGFAPARETETARVRREVSRALDFMEQADPELYGEIVSVVDELVVVSPDQSRRADFSAGTSFAAWGGIVVNADALSGWTDFYNMLAHEEGHILLFALAREEPLVLNANDEVFVSPVRDDPRPMDGIYHSAFVTAREAKALDNLLQWQAGSGGALSAVEQASVARSLEVSVISFWQSVEVLEEGAKLSGLGESILVECKDYMSRNFELIVE